MRSWRAAVLCFCALVSAVLIVTSLSLGYHLSRPVPFYDQWEFVRRINDIQAGRFGFADLVVQHNEHRIATARAVFLLDLWLADGTGYLSIAVLYLALGAIAALLARCFADSKPLALTVFLSCFALLVAPAQWENLSSGFQVQFPFVDLFAMSSLSCLIAAMAQVQRRERTWLLLTAASLFDMLAVFSMASGTLLLIPAMWIGLVLRSSPRVFVAFVVSHLVACLLFALGYTRITGIPPVFDPILLMQYALVYMGAALRGYPHGPLALGLIDALCLLASMGTMLVRSRAGPTAVDRVALFAASVALLLVANALLTAIGRASFGVASAVASRYSLQSLLLQPALLIVVWRQSRAWLSAPGMRFAFGSALLAAGTALSLLASLSTASRQEWRGRVDQLDRAGFALTQGLFDDGVLRLVYPDPSSIRQVVRAFAAERLGPFSALYGAIYRPPSNLLVGIDLSAISQCSADFGIERDGSRVTGVEGWAFNPEMPTGDGFAVVLDRSAQDRVVGFGRQSIQRDDVDQALHVSVGRSGFDIPLSLPPSSGGARTLTLLIVPWRAERPVCGKSVEIP